jgi:hypothetical protein
MEIYGFEWFIGTFAEWQRKLDLLVVGLTGVPHSAIWLEQVEEFCYSASNHMSANNKFGS